MEHSRIKQYFLFVFSGGVLAGIIGSYVLVGTSGIVFVCLLGSIIAFFLHIRHEHVIGVCVLIACAGMGIGMVRMHAAKIPVDARLYTYIDESISIEGIIARDPEERLGRIEYVMRNVEIVEDNKHMSVKGRLLVKGELGHDFAYGDKVLFTGRFSIPTAFETDTGRIFDYEGYLKKDGIIGIVSFAHGERVARGFGNAIMSGLFFLKHICIQHINAVVPVPESTLAAGLIVGERGSFSNDMTHIFRTAGLIHIIVLSGYNISVISEYTLFVLRKKFRKQVSLVLATLCIILFALLVGGGATVVRATIMGFLVLLARYDSRRYSITRALMCAVLCMALWNPLTIILDVSFHLSFLATLGLIYAAQYVETYFRWLPERWGIREAGVATLATQILVLPYLLYRMGELSVVAPFVNILVLPIIPFIMLGAFFVGIVGIFSYYLSYIVSFTLTPLLSYVLYMATMFADLPFASVVVPQLAPVFVLLLYVLIGIWMWRLHTDKNTQSITPDSIVSAYEIVEYEIIKNG